MCAVVIILASNLRGWQILERTNMMVHGFVCLKEDHNCDLEIGTFGLCCKMLLTSDEILFITQNTLMLRWVLPRGSCP